MTVKNKFLFFFCLVILVICPSTFFLLSKTPKKKTLRVLTYSSFAGVYGPGRIIKKQFKSLCDCELLWFLVEDSTALLQRFTLIPEIDVIIGWDQITLRSAENKNWEDLSFLGKEFVKTCSSKSFKQAVFFQNPYFLPLNWAPVGFIYKDEKAIVTSLKSLYKINGKISFPEPRSSTLGLQFYYWIYETFGGDEEQISDFLKKLKNKIYGPVFSWSMAYGFFQKGQTNMSLSYLSSLLYHHKEQAKESYFFAYFEEGHPYQLEYVSVSKESKNKDLAIDFVKFLLSKNIQKEILERHYMFSVSKELADHKLLSFRQMKFISYKNLDEFIEKKKQLLKLWEENLY